MKLIKRPSVARDFLETPSSLPELLKKSATDAFPPNFLNIINPKLLKLGS